MLIQFHILILNHHLSEILKTTNHPTVPIIHAMGTHVNGAIT